VNLKINYKIIILLIIILFLVLIFSLNLLEPEVKEINKVILNNDLNFR
jgi:hypothetical protein